MARNRNSCSEANLVAIEDSEAAGEWRCKKCRRFNHSATLYTVFEATTQNPDGTWSDFVLPCGALCGDCVNSVEEALQVWKGLQNEKR